VTVTQIDPKPVGGTDARNGSVVNLPTVDKVGFDGRMRMGRFDEKMFQGPPIDLKPGDSLLSTVSAEEGKYLPRMMRPSSKNSCPLKTAAVLTCLSGSLPADAFRPSLHGTTTDVLHLARNLKREKLPSKPIPAEAKKGRRGIEVLHKIRPASWDQTDVTIWTRVFQRPWIDVCFDGLTSPQENMPQYGREVARAVGCGALMLCTDIPAEAKEPLLVNMVQTGIDLYGALKAGWRGWPAHGGHGHGRKFLIVFAGTMLGDEKMMNVTKTFPEAGFSEDMQTVYGKCWTGAKVMYGGHVGAAGLKGKTGWGLYEDKHPKDWPAQIGENYRRCCLGHCWVGEAMAIRLLGMEKAWDHPAFLDYIDRWMNEDDSEHIKVIKEAKGWDYSAAHGRQRRTWDPLATAMYKAYRKDFGPMKWK
jgi:hypothetical protein